MSVKPVNWKKNVALFMIGQGLTLFGSMLVHYAIMWHITLQTKSGVMMTLITMAGALSMFFISPFAGVWADRYNKKYVINIADSVIAAITLVMAVLFSLEFEFIGLLLVCLGARALGFIGGYGLKCHIKRRLYNFVYIAMYYNSRFVR